MTNDEMSLLNKYREYYQETEGLIKLSREVIEEMDSDIKERNKIIAAQSDLIKVLLSKVKELEEGIVVGTIRNADCEKLLREFFCDSCGVYGDMEELFKHISGKEN